MLQQAVILFVHSGRDWIRGSERCLLDLVEGLDRTRYAPVVACDAPTLQREAAKLGARVEQFDVGDRLVPTRAAIGSAWSLLQRTGARLVHANMSNVIGPLLPAVRARRVPIVAHLHLTHDLADRRHCWLHQVDVAVGVARHVVAGLYDDGMPADRIRVIYNGIDPTRLDLGSDAPSRSSLGIAPDALVIVSVGSLIARKGHDVTIRALAELRTRGVDAHLVVCGDGDAESELAELAGGLGVAERLHLLGMRQDVGAIITTLADVYVSAAHSEALPLNVLEAQFLGRPVIASDIPAHQEAIAVERTGLLFPDGDPTPLADGLARLTAHPGERASFGQAGRARATAEFLVERYRREFYQLYEELLAAPASRFGFLHGPTWPATYGPWLRQVTARALRGTRRVQPVN